MNVSMCQISTDDNAHLFNTEYYMESIVSAVLLAAYFYVGRLYFKQ